jgi:hypothetical protein
MYTSVSDPGSGKITHKNKIKVKKVHVGCSLLRVEEFFCSIDVLY